MTRIAIVDKSKCFSEKCMDWCLRFCPVNRRETECIIKGADKKIIINEELCNGCGICKKCIFGAISIINLPEKLKEDPIHRYGINSFELFSLPVPKKESVIGIIGRNGIGKSTALDILSGNLKPNLGKYNEDVGKEEIINRYSNSILGKYFTKLFDNKIKVSYKPQRIELLSKLYKGKVRELIKKVDEKKISDKLIKELGLKNIEERDISKLSGGELQKLAIIACLCKKADVYYLDEPMSFLDIVYRIKVAKIIRELKERFIIVEHDLAGLDYISDEIQIVYGEAGCYGVFSQSKSVRRGINEYLDGFLPEDNVRFRDYKIIFNKFSGGKDVSEEVLFEFDELEKNFENFNLKTNKGLIHKQEVLGVVGANGLGKTTFLKLLSQEIKPDKGKIEKIKISYKPQQIYSEIEGTVLENLKKVAKEEFNSGWYKQNILEKLGLGKILNNEVKNLSGGELQKFHVAVTLSRDASLFAFDEPSAFIDVEDRLKVAEIIKEFILKKEKAAIVVDHDIQFIDYLSDSILVFEGESGKKGYVYGPCDKKEGMNRVLKNLGITYRRDKENNRPKINKPGSVLDKEQKEKGEYYYV
ncbi:MAG: ribosome biogenesis/translation initiation ATPase RLI [Nanoarchaeota archaeon]|nr:ribosome biogenesis/translation initiation ATPase RLI [Nanoarchaeota archaeon]